METLIDYLSEESRIFDALCDTYHLTQLIDGPTHKGHCLDNIFTSSREIVRSWGVGAPIEAHHCLTWVGISRAVTKGPLQSFVHLDYDGADWPRAQASFLLADNGQPWDLVAEISNPALSIDEASSLLQREILMVQRNPQVIPQREIRTRRPICGWMSKTLLRKTQRKEAAFREFRRNPTPQSKSRYAGARKKAKCECKNAKMEFCKEKFRNATNILSYWRTVRRFSGTTRVPLPPLVCSDGTLLTDSKAKAEALAVEFSTNFNPADCDPVDLGMGDVSPDWRCTVEEIADYIMKLNNSAAIGLDGISARMLKECVNQIAPPLAALLNRCLDEGSFPSVWKSARITPIQKQHGADSITQFRPISVLPVLSKVAERWFLRICRDFFFDPPDENQFAYLPGRSVTDALSLLEVYINAGFNSCPKTTKVAVVSLDIRKAFDQVPSNALLRILKEKYSLPSPLLHFLSSYLSNRTQMVQVAESESQSMPVISGVPQGSILGPSLFISYISGVLNSTLSAHTRLIAYADDLLIIRPIRDNSDCVELQQDLDIIIRNYADLFLTVNPAKSAYLLCTLDSPASQVTLGTDLLVNGAAIERVSTLKYLGVQLDERLNFGRHISLCAAKSKRAIGALFRTVGKWAGRPIFSDIYMKKVQPILLHALPAISPVLKRSWITFEKVHRFAGRLAANDYSKNYNSLLQSLSWKSLGRICVEQQICLVHKWVRGQRHFPTAVWDFRPPPRRPPRGTPVHNLLVDLKNDLFHRPGDRIPIRQNINIMPVHGAVATWNSLPPDLPELPFRQFKKKIQKFDTFSLLLDRNVNLYNNQPVNPALARFDIIL